MSSLCSVQERWSDENLEECLKLWKFDNNNNNDHRRQQMRELRTLLADIDHWKNDPFEVIRFLVDFRTVQRTHKMVRQMIEWRRTQQVDQFVETYCNGNNDGQPPQVMMDHVPLFLLNQVDREGHPLYVVRVGAMDAWGLYQAVGTQAILDYTRFIQEVTTTRDSSGGLPSQFEWQQSMYEEKQQQKQRLTQFTMLADLQGLSPRHLRPQLFGILHQVARCAQDHYAGFGKRIILLRAPAIFQWAWRVVKHFFDPHIQELIVFTTHKDYLEVCAQYMDLTALPLVLYDKGQGQAMPGFFERVRQEGGRVMPSHYSSHLKDVVLNDDDDLLRVEKPIMPERKDTADTSLFDSMEEEEEEEEQQEDEESLEARDAASIDTVKPNVTASTTVLFGGQWDLNNQVVVSV